MIGNLIQDLFLKQNNARLGAAVAITMMLIIAALVAVFLWAIGFWKTSSENGLRQCVCPPNALYVYALLFIVFLYGPVLLAPLFSFNDGTFATFPLKGFTLRHYADMAANTSMIIALKNSLVIAIVVSIAATLISLPAAIALTRFKLPAAAPS